MAFGSVILVPGVDVERTPTLNKAGISVTSLVRYRDSLIQKLGGWTTFFSSTIPGIPRELHAWQDLNQTDHLGIGSTLQLAVITNGVYKDITPQILTSNFAPSFVTGVGSTSVSVYDPNISNITAFDSIQFNVPISAGGLILSGVYPIAEVTGTSTYNFIAGTNAATTNVASTNATTNIGSTVLNYSSVASWIVPNMTVVDLTLGIAAATAAFAPGTVITTTSATTVTLSTAVIDMVSAGDNIVFCDVPLFSFTAGASIAGVNFIDNGLATTDVIVFPLPTTSATAKITIEGDYDVLGITDANDFTIGISNQAFSTAQQFMNGAQAQLVYYINIGPLAVGQGYGLGPYGEGGYGIGVSSGGQQQTGTEITATDWTSDNWGEIYLACPAGGGVFQYDPTSGFGNAGLVATAPPFNGGLFVSNQQQILVCWGSSVDEAIGIVQDPLTVSWSTIGDFTDFTPLATNSAGSYRIPSGSKIIAGIAAPQQDLIITDEDCWLMNFIGQPSVFGFVKAGAGAGAISSHSVQQLRGNVYWMGTNNFYAFTPSGLQVIPCPVWDFVFQNLSVANQFKVRAMPNTPFNEVGWFSPSTSGNGENDCYVKFNITEPNGPWDYGPSGALPRSAWIDQSVLGMPIAANPTGTIFQHETSPDAAGQPLTSTFTTGYFYIAEGEDFSIIDQILPDFLWGTFGGAQTAQIQITFFALNYPGDTPQQYGPYVVTQGVEYFTTRIRARQISIMAQSSDIGSFWRLGRIRYRYAPAGRR